MSFASGLSSYLYERAPGMYGGKQEEYLQLAEEAMGRGLKTLSREIASNTKPSEIFFKLLDQLRNERHEIALKHTTDKARLFGALRAEQNLPVEEGYLCVLTPLGDKYLEYNKIFLKQLGSVMAGLKRDLRSFEEKKASFQETVLGRRVVFEAEVIDAATDLPRLRWNSCPNEEELNRALGTSNKNHQEVAGDYNLLKQLKNQHPDLYKRWWVNVSMVELISRFPSPKKVDLPNGDFTYIGNSDNLKTQYVIGTLRLEIEGKLYALSRYVTWMYQDHSNDPVERMKKRSVAEVVHQDTFLIDITLKEVSKMFEQVVLWDKQKESIQELKNRVALFRFTYAHCMPCARGDGAIGDWFELILYRFHGFSNTRFNSEKLSNFEPLVSTSLSRYLEAYDSIIYIS